MAADALDIITVAEFDAAINVDAEDPLTLAEKEQIITAASRIVDQVFGPVVAREVTDEVYDGGGRRIWLRQTPVLSVDEVTEYDYTTAQVLTAEDNATKPAYGYRLIADRHNAQLVRRSGGADTVYASGAGNVVVTYTAGRYDTTDEDVTIDPRFKEACVEVAIHLWQARGGAAGSSTGDGAPYGGIPFSMKTLRDRLRAMLPDDVPPPAVA